MAYIRFDGKAQLDKGEYFRKNCMCCQQESDIYETLWNGEKFEGWSYCKYCDVETFHPIEKLPTESA